MYSLILATASRYLLLLLLIFSVFLLLRGHNEPGGGFTGGLVGASAYALYFIANGIGEARRVLRFDPQAVVASGLLLAALSTLPSLVAGEPFMTAIWIDTGIPLIGKVGTPLLFDFGVYLLVLGMTLSIVFTLAGEEVRP
ncbi:MAG: Na+/H+ antiporter subunit B [Prosthecochloris sp.]|uniref:Na+/H+ antiporter MnhB subunit-related protein n=1 Tax=Prosthecochloris aestuarii (strain DSM 271 / SK 413) TaxID=290512 RepID=B4S361_PROA2|nr:MULTISPECIES: Na+/H+ antiporter subunit B [Prosthecochloris]ACF45155.1 Na+/H+ antiporter MnhB subunit-related protein [Prosthecochloris aestuarii DSM 271]MCW8797602.1 Na+/H+ antiporter subunit B [Prosthecochloris sp.]NEX12305.1 Na(+)/H(+) antiporter subunit B [Prosthecochloris sp.]RDD31185.1 Na(+)/H(+) antiporter subunit B [Prosthecochloris sp. ZM]